jgi:hypothetical protein
LHDVLDSAGKVIIHADDCSKAPFYLNAYLGFNIVYNVLIVYLLKFGGSNILYMGITSTVPIVNLAFTMDFMPKHVDFTIHLILGLIIILLGLCIYRFSGAVIDKFFPEYSQSMNSSSPASDESQPHLLEDEESIQSSSMKSKLLNSGRK